MNECNELIKRLESEDSEELRDAAFLAGETGCVEAVPLLAELLKSHNIGVQEAAETALRQIGGSATIDAVINLLRSDEAPIRNMSMDILRHVGNQDFKRVVNLIHDTDPDIRIFASDILGSTNDVMAVGPLCDALLKDPEVNVRYQAAVSLGNLAFQEAARCLNKAMSDEEWVQFAVIEALIKIRDESSVNALLKAMDSSSDLVSSMIVDALGEMGNVKAVAILLKRLEKAPAALRNKIAKAIVKILGGKSLMLLSKNDREKLRGYLISALQDDEIEIQDVAISGLGFIGNDEASSAVIKIASSFDSDKEADRIEAAVKAMANLGHTSALENGIRSDNNGIASFCVKVLATINDSKASTLLMEAFPGKNRDLQREILFSLLRIAGPEASDFFLDVLKTCKDGTSIKAALKFVGIKFPRRDAADIVFSFLDHPYNDVKETALDACIGVNGEEIIARFKSMLESDQPLYRLMATFALGKIDCYRFIPELEKACEDSIPDIRKAALEALGNLPCNDELLAVITSKLKDDVREVRQTVVDILGKWPVNKVLSYLLEALDDPDDWVKVRAIKTLGTARAREALPKLSEFHDYSGKLVVLSLIEALGNIGGQAAFRTLLEYLNSDDPDLQSAAETAIEKIQQEE